MEHYLAQHARHEVGEVVALPRALDRNALEIFRAAGAGQVEVFHEDTGWMYSIRDEPRC